MSEIKKILVTGGAGYIGSHTCVELLNSGFDVVVIDNLSNSHQASLQRVQSITAKTLQFIRGDLRLASDIDAVFSMHAIDAVIHFAGLKAVGESVEQPIAYYQNNLTGTINLIEAMQKHQVKNIVFYFLSNRLWRTGFFTDSRRFSAIGDKSVWSFKAYY
jgi:UDP-glucose 4-epimerase